jgi:hypothetical protein
MAVTKGPAMRRTGASVEGFLARVPDEQRREDAQRLCAMMQEITGEPPAMWGTSIIGFGAYHYRYASGFVEEAGGGRGRERPWRQSYDGLTLQTRQDDPPASKAAAEALNQVWVDRLMSRARRGLISSGGWPKSLDESLGSSATRMYVTPEEAAEMYSEIQKTWNRLFGAHHRFAERRDPKLRPADAMPIEFVLLAYPLLDLPPLPDEAEQPDEADANEGGEAEGSTLPDESASPG